MIMKSGEINAASVACYIASLERENEWLRDRNMEMIDISAVSIIAQFKCTESKIQMYKN